MAMADHRFYSLRVRNFAAPMTNRDENPAETLNDMQALIIGTVRDDLDARLLLTGNFRYQGYNDLGLPPVSMASNAHFEEFEKRGYDFWSHLSRTKEQWPGQSNVSGSFTTRAWAVAHYNAGTNRRAFEYAMQVFLCATKEQWKDYGLPDPFVRRDVDRNSGGNPLTYQTLCRNCHSIMDGMGGAFANYDFKDGSLVFLNDIAPKINQNGQVWPDGYITVDSAWVNYATQHHNESFGWRGPLSGNGLREFATMIANSKGFSQCMTKKVFKEVCRRPITEADMPAIVSLADGFENDGYRFKSLFAHVATDPICNQRNSKENPDENFASFNRRITVSSGSKPGCPYRP